MTIQSHLQTLEKKHGALEDEIAEALAHPSMSDIVLIDLKRKKLHIKEEIERIKRDKTRH
jgi:hypothetical protein